MRAPIDRAVIYFALTNMETFNMQKDERHDAVIDMFNSTVWHPELRVLRINRFGLSCEAKREDFKRLFSFTEEQLDQAQEKGFSGPIDAGTHMRAYINYMEIIPPVEYL